MRFGFYLPTRGKTCTPEALTTIVQHAEKSGFLSTMVGDHLVFPVTVNSTYPYTASGVFPGGGEAMEQLSTIAFLAAKTTTLRLVTSVLIVPQRNPVATAKVLSTIDVLSGGRLTLGIGVGWMREEFEALDSQDFDRRGAVTDLMRCAACPGRCRRHIYRSGLAAAPRRRCAAPRVTATAGIRWAPIRRCRCHRMN